MAGADDVCLDDAGGAGGDARGGPAIAIGAGTVEGFNESGRDAAWVHAHLHRVEGDDANARYWYRRAGRPASAAPLDAEWDEIAAALLRG